MAEWPRRLSILLIVIVLGICIYRARTQSFSTDEAWAYNSFVAPPLSKMAQEYDACNHVLHTLLLKVAKASLGGGELALRTPSLMAALFYCIACYRLTRLLLSPWPQLLAMMLLTLTPVLLDFMIAARGYGLGLCFLMWAIYSAISWATRGFELKWLRRAGVFAGLATGANLIMIVPAAALGLGLLLVGLRDHSRGIWTVVDKYGGPAVTIAFLIVIIPILPATKDNFYYGATTLKESVRSIAEGFIKTDRHWPGSNPDPFLDAVGYVLLPILLAALLLLVITSARRYIRSQPAAYRSSAMVILGTTAVASALLWIVLHSVAGVKYPLGRTGIYFWPVWIVAGFYALHLDIGTRFATLTRTAGYVLALGLAFVAIRQTDSRYFYEWKYDAGTRNLIRFLEADMRGRKWDHLVRVGTDPLLRETARWYRNRRRLDWMAEPQSDNVETDSFDYYLFSNSTVNLVSRLNLQQLNEDPVAGSVLARRRQ